MLTPEHKKTLIIDRLKVLEPSFLDVIDQSDQHVGHAGYQGGGRHFAIIIQASVLNDIEKVEAHRKIYTLLADLIPHEIHALRIIIK